jgi:hypothetical protein
MWNDMEKQVTLNFKRCGLKKYGKMKCFIASCTRKQVTLHFKRCSHISDEASGGATGSGPDRKWRQIPAFFLAITVVQNVPLRITDMDTGCDRRSRGLIKYGKMKCFITSCTSKASNVSFQTLRFEKVRGKSTGKWNVL